MSDSESEESCDEDLVEKLPTVAQPKNKDEQRVMKRDDETPSPYSFTKSDIDQLDLEENEETLAAFKVSGSSDLRLLPKWKKNLGKSGTSVKTKSIWGWRHLG